MALHRRAPDAERQRCLPCSSNSCSSKSPPVVESQTMPTSWPAATCASVRSRTWRKMPPTGERKQWTIRSFWVTAAACASIGSEQAFADVDRVAGQQRIGSAARGRSCTLPLMSRVMSTLALVGARREAAGDRDRLLHGHAGHVGILAGRADFAHDEDRTVAVDLDRHVGIAQIALAQLGGDRRLRSAARCGRAPAPRRPAGRRCSRTGRRCRCWSGLPARTR